MKSSYPDSRDNDSEDREDDKHLGEGEAVLGSFETPYESQHETTRAEWRRRARARRRRRDAGRCRAAHLERVLLQRPIESDHEIMPVGRGVCPRSPGRPGRDHMGDQGLRQRLHVEERALGRWPPGCTRPCSSRMSSWMRLLATITSTAATRPPPIFGRRRCETTPRSTPARIERTCGCLTAGKNSTRRRRLGRVDRVHGREHEMARLGGLQRRLGGLGCRAARRSGSRPGPGAAPGGEPRGTSSVSSPDLALVDDAVLILVEDLDRVIDRDDVLAAGTVDVAIIAASVVVLPAPVAPVTRITAVLVGEPLHARGQAPSLSKSGTSRGITRTRTRSSPRWRNTFTRNRGSPLG